MPNIDLLNQDYPSKSLDQNQSRLVNMYLEGDKSKGKYPIIAISYPGTTLFCDTGESEVRAMLEHNGVLYVIAGNKFYSVDTNGVLSAAIGTLSTSSGFCKIKVITGSSDNNNQIIIIDGTNGYTYNIGTTVATFPIADVDFPQNCIDLAVQDDYAIVLNSNSIKYNISNLSDLTSWNALDFASKVGEADRLAGLVSHQSKVWLFGTKTTEIWYNSGNALFPFERIPDTFLHYGCAAKESIATNDDYIIFLCANAKGGYSIMKAQPSIAYVPTPISTQVHDTLISSFTTISDARGYCFFKDGHEFYQIVFPTEQYTLTLDISSGAINEKQSNINGIQTRAIDNCQAFCYQKNLIGAFNSGKIYYLNSLSYTEDGNQMLRSLVTPGGILYAEGKRVFINRLQIDVETGIGSNKTFTLEKSMDNGSTWITVNTYTIPDKGGRIFENNLGSSRYGILFRITTTMDAKFIILGFQAEIKVGHS